MILYGMELITISAMKLMGWQNILCSAALGIERKEKSEGFAGTEPARICVIGDHTLRNWAHEVGMQSLRTRRTLQLSTNTLPGEIFQELLVSKESKRRVYKTNLHRTSQHVKVISTMMQSFYMSCKHYKKKEVSKQMWKSLNLSNRENVSNQTREYKDASEANRILTTNEILEGRQTKTAAIYAITMGQKSITLRNAKLKNTSRITQNFRKLRAGQIRNLNANNMQVLRKAIWDDMSYTEKRDTATCKCLHGGVQDMMHVLYDCTFMKESIDEALEKTIKAISTFGTFQHEIDFTSLTRDQQINSSLSGLQLKYGNSNFKVPKIMEKILIKAWSQVYTEVEIALAQM
jgi:hypothetical protein